MKICSINSRGFNSQREKLIFDHAKTFDMTFVQETMITDPQRIKSLRSRWPGPSFWAPALGKQGGVAILVNSNFSGRISSWCRDSSGRVLSLLIEYNDFRINVVNIYAPAVLSERKAFFESLHQFFIPAGGIILGGDFNCYESHLDKFGGNFVEGKYLTDFRKSFNLTDVWRRRNPQLRVMTWFNSDFTIGSRLDKFFLSRDLLQFVESADITPCCLSDHDFVNLSFVLRAHAPRGPGLWKINNSLLEDESFRLFITERISDLILCKVCYADPASWWDFLKESLKQEIIFFAREKNTRLHRERVFLTNRLIALKRRLTDAGENSLAPEIASCESQLAANVSRSLEGAKIRSRVQWLEDGEKPSRYFFKLEKERSEKNFVNSILDANDVEVSDLNEIERAHVEFYTKLFSPEPVDLLMKENILSEISNFLSEPDRESCEGLLSLAELTASIKSLNYNKAPGLDGLSVEFYLKFWDLFGPQLLDVINSCFARGKIGDSMRASATRLVYKKRGDIKNLKNWRPISLLNTDYKICSKAITLRLSKVLDSIIDPDQTCSIPGRSISNNIVTLRDTLEYIEVTNETGILLSLDQEKAFDRVDRAFLMDLLKRFGFGPDFCKWISTFYFGANMQIILNGWLTAPIPLLRGVRQGDPLSPLLYVMCVEVLACQIRNSPNIQGFLLPGANGKQFRVRQYADDTTCFVKNLYSLRSLFEVISAYERGSGAKLNRSKTEAMWVGAWRDCADTPLGLSWVRKMKIVGVVFGTVPVVEDNWQPKINKLEKSLGLWKARSLSLIGKSLIVNVLGLSKLLYLAKVLVPPDWVFARVNSLVWPFIWGSKIETVSRDTCHLPDLSGGLNVTNFRIKCSALRVAAIASIADLSADPCFYLLKYFIGARLASLRPEWGYLRDNVSPSALSPSPFYDKCLRDLGGLAKMLSSSATLSTKNVYSFLLKVKSSPPLLHRRWSCYLSPGFSLMDHWGRVRDGFTENFKNDVSWLITFRASKVRDSLKNWGYIASDRCAVCDRKESIDHCFLNCGRSRSVWEHFAPLLSRLIRASFPINVLTVFFFRWTSDDRKSNRIAYFLIKTILHAIWRFRNKAVFHNGTETHRAVVKYVLQDFKGRIKLDYFRLSRERFLDIWGLPFIVSLRDDRLNFMF